MIFSWISFIASLALGLFLFSTQYLQNIWVYPLAGRINHFALWICFSFLYVVVKKICNGKKEKLGALLAGILSILMVLVFSFWLKIFWFGLAAVFLPFCLWLILKRDSFLNKILWIFVLVLFLWNAHFDKIIQPGMVRQLSDWRFTKLFLIAPFVFKWFQLGLDVFYRFKKFSLFAMVEYFLAPPFWLSPNMAFMLTSDNMEKNARSGTYKIEQKNLRQGSLWIAQGFLHGVIFWFLLQTLAELLKKYFERGIIVSSIHEWVFFGFIILVISYFEKSRMSFITAGLLRAAGYAIEPDFKSVWRAKSLLDYWRRFHFWIWQYYSENFYAPIVYFLNRFFPASIALVAGIFITFFIGTSISHTIFYPGSVVAAIFLGFVFGLFSLLHYFIDGKITKWISIPFTWLSVFILYILAYPIYGLGWSLTQLLKAIIWKI